MVGERQGVTGHDVGDSEGVRDEVVGVGEGAFERVEAQAHPRSAVLEDERDRPALRRDAVVIGDLADRAREGGFPEPAPLSAERAVDSARLGQQVPAAVALDEVIHHGSGLEHRRVSIGHHRNLAGWAERAPFGFRPELGGEVDDLDLVGQPAFLAEPDGAEPAGAFDVVDLRHGVLFSVRTSERCGRLTLTEGTTRPELFCEDRRRLESSHAS